MNHYLKPRKILMDWKIHWMKKKHFSVRTVQLILNELRVSIKLIPPNNLPHFSISISISNMTYLIMKLSTNLAALWAKIIHSMKMSSKFRLNYRSLPLLYSIFDGFCLSWKRAYILPFVQILSHWNVNWTTRNQ